MTESGIEQRVHPAMVPKHSAIAEVSGVTNCVAIDGDFVGNLLLAGPGAGARATASAVAERHPRHRARRLRRRPSACRPPSSSPTSAPSSASTRAPTTCASPCSTGRAPWPASPGAWASAEVSLESIVQRRPRGAQPGIGASPTPGAPTSVILITHETTEEAIRGALDAIDKDGTGVREAADDTHRAAVRRVSGTSSREGRDERRRSKGTTPRAGSTACWFWRSRA